MKVKEILQESVLNEGIPQKVKDQLIDDFKEWSGGFTPDECTREQIEEYIDHSLSTEILDSDLSKLVDMDAVSPETKKRLLKNKPRFTMDEVEDFLYDYGDD